MPKSSHRNSTLKAMNEENTDKNMNRPKDERNAFENCTFAVVRYETIAGRDWAAVDIDEDEMGPADAIAQHAGALAFPHDALFWEILPADNTPGAFELRVMLGDVTPENEAIIIQQMMEQCEYFASLAQTKTSTPPVE